MPFQLDDSVPTTRLPTVYITRQCEGRHVEWKIKESDLGTLADGCVSRLEMELNSVPGRTEYHSILSRFFVWLFCPFV